MAPYGGGFFAGIGNMATGTNRAGSQPNFSGGIIARMGAINKLERRAARGMSTARGDLNLARIAKMNAGPGSLATTTGTPLYSSTDDVIRSFFAGTAIPNTNTLASSITTTPTPLGSLINKAAAGEALTVGERRYLTVAGIQGAKSRSFMQALSTTGGGAEMRTAMGTAGIKTFATNVNNLVPGTGALSSGVQYVQMTDTAEKVIRPLVGALEGSSELRMLASSRGLSPRGGAVSLATEISDRGIIKSLGTRGAIQAARAGGARVGLAVAGEAALAAVPGLNLIFAADLAYQLAKLGGVAVKGAINFGRDAMKSMQGNMSAGVMGGFGYKDDELRATSRARGVMAIQNSRLNARSLLGSEGAMMAAHYG